MSNDLKELIKILNRVHVGQDRETTDLLRTLRHKYLGPDAAIHFELMEALAE